jgi:hypothetical protein
MVSRRTVLSMAAALPIAACAGQSASQVTQEVVSDIGLVATGLNGALPALAQVAGISASTVATVGQYVGKVQTLASGVSTALSTSSALSTVQQIGSVIGQIATVAGPLLPPPWGTAVAAAEVLLPVIEAGVGMIVNATNSTAAPGAAAPVMSPDAARLILRGFAAQAP